MMDWAYKSLRSAVFLAVVALGLIGFTPTLFGQDSDPFQDDGYILSTLQRQYNSALRSWLNAVTPDSIPAVANHARVGVKTAKPKRRRKTADAIYRSAKPSVLMVCDYYDCGKCSEVHAGVIATAVALSADGVCLTNHHVVETIRAGGADTTGRVYGHFLADAQGRIYPIRAVLSYSKEADLALLQVDAQGQALHPLPLGETAQVGEPVYCLSHPKGRELYYFSQGHVCRNTMDKHEHRHRERMEVSADFAVGSSGGPIIDARGNLVGLVANTRHHYADDTNKTNQQLVVRTAIPVVLIEQLLEGDG